MLRWFEKSETSSGNVVYSRVRLARNLDAYRFPQALSDTEGKEVVKRLQTGLKDLPADDGRGYEYASLEELKELDRMALRERRILNSGTVAKKSPTGIILSEDESTSFILNGDDHIRLQIMSPGLHLDELWQRADRLDDYVNTRFSYAYDEKYGYLTSYPTNVGTGLRASAVLHLPTLSMGKKFQNLLAEMSRFGVSIRGVYGEGSDNYGALYEIASAVLHLPTLSMGKKFQNLLAEMSRFGVSIRGVYGEGSDNYGALYEIANQKTLGQSEKEIIELVTKIARQLDGQEKKVRKLALENHRLEREDEAYKSYGVLKFARRLTRKDAMIFLSQLMSGISDGLLRTEEPCSIYRLMLGIQTANLQKLSSRPLSQEELDIARAAYLRTELPRLRDEA